MSKIRINITISPDRDHSLYTVLSGIPSAGRAAALKALATVEAMRMPGHTAPDQPEQIIPPKKKTLPVASVAPPPVAPSPEPPVVAVVDNQGFLDQAGSDFDVGDF